MLFWCPYCYLISIPPPHIFKNIWNKYGFEEAKLSFWYDALFRTDMGLRSGCQRSEQQPTIYSCWQVCITSDEGDISLHRPVSRQKCGQWGCASSEVSIWVASYPQGRCPANRQEQVVQWELPSSARGHWRGITAGLCLGNMPQGRLDSTASDINNWRAPRMFLRGVLSRLKGTLSFGRGEWDINTHTHTHTHTHTYIFEIKVRQEEDLLWWGRERSANLEEVAGRPCGSAPGVVGNAGSDLRRGVIVGGMDSGI